MKYSLPPFNEREKRIFLEERILDFSSILFRIPVIGLIISVILNILLYKFYDKLEGKFFIVLCSLTCFYILNLIIEQLTSFQKNE